MSPEEIKELVREQLLELLPRKPCDHAEELEDYHATMVELEALKKEFEVVVSDRDMYKRCYENEQEARTQLEGILQRSHFVMTAIAQAITHGFTLANMAAIRDTYLVAMSFTNVEKDKYKIANDNWLMRQLEQVSKELESKKPSERVPSLREKK